jgi:kumamolisin
MPKDYGLQIEFVFKLRNADRFHQCLNSISDPTSPDYGHFLNSATLQPYVPTPGQRASLAKYLASRGFDVRFGPSPLVLKASASVTTVESTLGVRVRLYSRFYSADSDPTLPANLADLVTGVFGLDNITRVRHVGSPNRQHVGVGGTGLSAESGSPCSGPYCPQGLQVGYSFTGLYANGFDGTGQKVAVVAEPGDPLIQISIDTFSSQYGLPPTTIALMYPDGEPTSYDLGWAAEAAMDVEAVHAVAPGAQIVLLYDSVDLVNAIDYVATNHVANIVSNSWGYICSDGEPCTDSQLDQEYPGLVSSVHSRLGIDAAQGLTILFASGNSGAQPGGTIGTGFPASDPNVLAVGATNLVLTGCGTNTCSGYGSETAAYISGGGYSSYFPEPSWQTSTIGTKTGRAVPDISMLGYVPGVWVYSAYTSSCGGAPGAGWFSCAGTSLSTPLWAGFLAIVLQMRDGSALGNLGPKLYQLASSSSYASDFHDITIGNNGYPATTGWDPVTGWGTPVASNLAADLSSGAPLTNGVGGGLYEVINAPANSWYVIFPSTSGKPSSSNCAPANASPSDWTATALLMGQMKNGQLQNFDTDSAVWASSAPIGTSRNYMAFGGPLVNNFVCYYETKNAGLAVYQSSGGYRQFVANTLNHPVLIGTAGDFNGLPLEMTTAGSNGMDLFLLEGFKDPSTGNVFIVAYGFTYYGTFAAGIYLKFINSQATGITLTNSLYIVEWKTVGTAGALPAPGDTYTIVYTQRS